MLVARGSLLCGGYVVATYLCGYEDSYVRRIVAMYAPTYVAVYTRRCVADTAVCSCVDT